MERITNSKKGDWKKKFSRRLDTIQQLLITLIKQRLNAVFINASTRENIFIFSKNGKGQMP
jgi:hypothetical protein